MSTTLKNNLNRLLVVASIGWATTGGAAVQSLTVQAALQKGFSYSNEIKKAASQVTSASESLTKARSSLFPTLSAKVSAVSGQKAVSFFNILTPSAAQNADTYTAEMDLSQPLYAGGGITAGIDLYKTNEDLARQQYFSTKQTTVTQILTAYYLLAQVQALLKAAEQNRDILQTYVKITTQYEKTGRSRRMDRLQAQVNYSLALSDLEQITTNLKNAQSGLNRFLGEVSVTPVAEFKASILPVETLDFEKAVDIAVKNNPDVKVAEIKVTQVQYNKDIDLASQDMPLMNLTGAAGYTAPDASSLWANNSQYYNVGITLTVPLFSGLSSLSKRRGYAEVEYQAKRDLQIAKDTLRQNVATSLANLKSTKEQFAVATDAVSQARQALDMANKGYQQGVVSSTDVVNLQNTRYNSEKLYINTQFSYLQALLSLRQLMGIDLEKAYAK